MSATRVRGIDIARGLAIVLMALDHVRDFLTEFPHDPLDIAKTTPAYFLTRWVTHLCAPLFIFLAGASAHLRMRSGSSKAELASYLASRGILLILLEATVVGFAWWFRVGVADPGLTLQVIWVIGASMILLSLAIFLPTWLAAALAVALIGGHNLVPHHADAGLWGHLVHQPGIAFLGPFRVYVAYPLVPWVAVMILGFVSGPLFTSPAQRQRRVLLSAAVALGIGFVALRILGLYGDPRPFDPESKVPWMSFLHVAKYPPSLHYLLAMGSAVALCLAIVEAIPERASRYFIVFGRAPLFFYIAHLYLCHGAAVVIGALQGYRPEQFFTFFTRFPAGFGLSLPGIYVAWAMLVAILYQPSQWYRGLRRRYPRLMSYL